MAHTVHLGPGSCDGRTLRARNFMAAWLRSEAAAAGLDVRVVADDEVRGEDFVADPDRHDAEAVRIWLRLSIGRMGERLDRVAEADMPAHAPGTDDLNDPRMRLPPPEPALGSASSHDPDVLAALLAVRRGLVTRTPPFGWNVASGAGPVTARALQRALQQGHVRAGPRRADGDEDVALTPSGGAKLAAAAL